MTEVTVTGKKEITGLMCMEIVKGTFSDGYTYTSKFGTIDCVQVQSRSRAGAYATVSGGVVTLVCSSASGDTFDLVIFGH
jgi:hypothetical protein